MLSVPFNGWAIDLLPPILSFPFRPDTYLVTPHPLLIISFPTCHQNQEAVLKISVMIYFPLTLDKILDCRLCSSWPLVMGWIKKASWASLWPSTKQCSPWSLFQFLPYAPALASLNGRLEHWRISQTSPFNLSCFWLVRKISCRHRNAD